MEAVIMIPAALIVTVLVFVLYFLPTLMARRRHHHQSGAIFVLNLFLGWTLLGWVIALAMAASTVKAAPKEPNLPNTRNGSGPELLASTTSDARLPCPLCAEAILLAAKVCPHCRSELPREGLRFRPRQRRDQPPVRPNLRYLDLEA